MLILHQSWHNKKSLIFLLINQPYTYTGSECLFYTK